VVTFLRGCLTTEYTGLRKTLVKLYGGTDSSSDSNSLSRLPESRSYLHIQVCAILIYPTGRRGDRQSVKRTLDPSPTSVQDVGVNHCRAHLIMSEKFLNCSGVMLLQAVIGLSYIDEQQILSMHGKRNRLSSPSCSAKSALPHASLFQPISLRAV